MPNPQLILPQADSACGKVFFPDRRTAEGHRIALEVWNRATGRVRQGYRLSVYRCRRCAGFHLGNRPTDRTPIPAVPGPDHGRCRPEGGDGGSPRVREVGMYHAAWF